MGALARLASVLAIERIAIARAIVAILEGNEASGLESTIKLAEQLSEDDGARQAMAAMDVIPPLRRQLETSECSDEASQSAANTLAKIALDADYKVEVMHALITARHCTTSPRKKDIAAQTLHTLSSDEDDPESNEAVGFAILLFRLHTRD